MTEQSVSNPNPNNQPLTLHMEQEGYINSEGETVLPEHDKDDWKEYEKQEFDNF